MAESLAGPVLVDLRACFGSNARRGIGRFTAGLAQGIAQRHPDSLFFAPGEALQSGAAVELGLELLPLDRPTLKRHLRDAAAYHVGSLFELPIAAPVIPDVVTASGIAVSCTFYDAIPYAEPHRYQSTDHLRRWYEQRGQLLRTCDRLLAISRHAATQATELLDIDPRRVAFIGAGVDERFRLPDSIQRATATVAAALPQVIRRTIVCVAGNDPRKNADSLIRGFALLPSALRATHQLVIVGRLDTSFQHGWEQVAVDAGCEADEVIFAGELDDDVLVALYQTAALSAFPSLSEGFGLPVAEAAACGCPTVSSNATSVPEVLDWSPSTFDATDPTSIAVLLERGLTDDAFRRQLVEVGAAAASRWRWNAVADRALAAMAQVAPRGSAAKRRRRDHGSHRPRIAIVGPFGGSPSGIGAYNERLLPHLDEVADLTCFVEKFWGEAPLGTDGRRWPTESLGRHIDPASFDHVIITLGNSPFHLASALQFAQQHPAHIWLHEANLAELHIGTVNLLRNQQWGESFLGGAVEAQYGQAVVAELSDGGWDGMLDVAEYQRRELRLLGAALANARSAVVSSQVAADCVAADGYRGPTLVLPIAFPPTHAQDVPPRPEIVVLGWLSTAKGADRVAAILAQVRQRVDARLIFIGRPLDGALEAIDEAATRRGVRDAIEVLGYLPDDEMQKRLAGCSVGLRLSTRTDGEQSAAVTDLVALGIPVVTNLATMSPSTPGLTVLPDASDTTLAAALTRLVIDPDFHAVARADALARAASWGFRDVAAKLVEWLGRQEQPG